MHVPPGRFVLHSGPCGSRHSRWHGLHPKSPRTLCFWAQRTLSRVRTSLEQVLFPGVSARIIFDSGRRRCTASPSCLPRTTWCTRLKLLQGLAKWRRRRGRPRALLLVDAVSSSDNCDARINVAVWLRRRLLQAFRPVSPIGDKQAF
jgi:hypothetical protein